VIYASRSMERSMCCGFREHEDAHRRSPDQRPRVPSRLSAAAAGQLSEPRLLIGISLFSAMAPSTRGVQPPDVLTSSPS
jgi:hypothetical protein